MIKDSTRAAIAFVALTLPAAAQADPVPLCAVGYSVPRITPADLAAVSDVALVDVNEVVAAPGKLECRVKATVRQVERGLRYSAGQALDFRLNCAGAGSTLRHPNSPWLYSDLPTAGMPGRLYDDPRFAPPGPHFLNVAAQGEAVALASPPGTSGESRSLC